jgi:hypothetical protein
LAASAARVFGWDKGGTTVHADKALVVTTEQLQLMRELCDADVYESPRFEGSPQPFPASSGPVGYEVKVGRPLRTIEASCLHPVADVRVETHKELESHTKTGLMQTAAKAAIHAAQKPPLDVSNTSQLRDLAQSAARIFGWDNGGTTIHADKALVVTTKQLQQMRELCDASSS